MKTFKPASSFKSKRQTVVTIGTFDGVHLGHRKIIYRLNEVAKSKKLDSALLTFFPHPRMVLQQKQDLKLINTIDERINLLSQTGLDHLVIEPFTKTFSRLKAQEYVKQYLVDYLNAAVVIVGYDHRFGRNRTANIEDLKRFAKTYNFEVEEISKQDIDDVAISSTKIRSAITEGQIHLANTYLSKPFVLTGKVVKGKQLGKSLGYPTANLQVKEDYKIIPKEGVYVVSAYIDSALHYGMMNIGHNPTIANNNRKSVETYFFDFSGNLYDKTIQIQLLKRLRNERKFDSLEALKSAMQKDEKYSKDFIKTLR
ncbi:bifunctional riboflavin kinase/FAD synthetase [Mesohalobacter halotolerans]|uniref:Riboflavin biosynthesis protein n=1 Tax=Mesohalobacter halotolerans TaxID=1883405 RepID=A0A4U5TS11_9FLAO|nr:bifunctional riboflavin kinase/FAD synthetase [Mesohalobacter halotolerans]MBS3737943.1 bifunctional riboflavin kinase/FAD synthetase [Psychroflexus sp.]TKS56194.1 bifunctional riboflavin kinase/FAD synthetase [Mesohalobacter halotolerans]